MAARVNRKAKSHTGGNTSSVSFRTQNAVPQVKAARNNARIASLCLFFSFCMIFLSSFVLGQDQPQQGKCSSHRSPSGNPFSQNKKC